MASGTFVSRRPTKQSLFEETKLRTSACLEGSIRPLIFQIPMASDPCWCVDEGHRPLEIGDGSWDSWTVPFLERTDIACEKVKNMSGLSDGFDIVGLSQGIYAGIASIPFCGRGIGVCLYHCSLLFWLLLHSGIFFVLVDYLIELRRVTSDYEHLTPAGYLKILTVSTILCGNCLLFLLDLPNYLKGCKFLPKLNNECVFASLENLVLIMRVDTKGNILVWIYPDGTFDPVLPAQENVATGAASSSWTPWVHGFYRRMVRLFKDRPLLLSVH
ncbi:hypothetical protein ACJRO7_018112 [Eucalyptus globulus]|uniref:Uncharacterized protein n=1 Tax=Eucalyptus globulus TaxID=34317 RepID=A0ABD3KTK2_EUCGL